MFWFLYVLNSRLIVLFCTAKVLIYAFYERSYALFLKKKDSRLYKLLINPRKILVEYIIMKLKYPQMVLIFNTA